MLINFAAEKVGKARFNVATPTYATFLITSRHDVQQAPGCQPPGYSCDSHYPWPWYSIRI